MDGKGLNSSAKVQIGAELLCKSAKVKLGVGLTVFGRQCLEAGTAPRAVLGSLAQRGGRDGDHVPTSIQPSCDAVPTLPIEALQQADNHAVAIFFAHAGAGREAKALLEETFADFAAVHFGGGEDGLEVHGLPDGTGFDVLGFKRETDLLARDTSDCGIDGQAGKPAG